MMRMMALAIVLSVAVLCGARPAVAQVCGDADGSGLVTVTDGVLTLRAAAKLDSPCTIASCDLDGSGVITVTDGVNVLRKAAGLSATTNCSGTAADQPATVLRELQVIFKYGVGFATGTPITSCANAPDGEIDVTIDQDGTTTDFSGCEVEDLHLYGLIVAGTSLLTFTGFEADTTGDEDFISDYDGDLALGNTGGGRSLDGMLDVSTESADLMTLTFAGATVVAGTLTAGSATVDLTDSEIANAFTQLVLTFDGSGVAMVVATQGNGATARFRYDIANGSTVPAS